MSTTGTIYVLPDLHGCLAQLRRALEVIPVDDPGTTLVFLGDYIDRGPDGAGVAYAVKEIDQRLGDRSVALLGNHESWFLDWLDTGVDDPHWLLGDDGLVTVRSFLDGAAVDRVTAALSVAREEPSALLEVNDELRRRIRERHANLLAWLRARPLYYETPQQIFVHAGIDEEAEDLWRLATPDHMFTEKYPPTTGPFPKRIIAGHVGTGGFHRNGSHDPFVDEGHVYLDGSVERTGQLNVLACDVASGDYRVIVVGEGR